MKKCGLCKHGGGSRIELKTKRTNHLLPIVSLSVCVGMLSSEADAEHAANSQKNPSQEKELRSTRKRGQIELGADSNSFNE